jgi:hypothetical protein
MPASTTSRPTRGVRSRVLHLGLELRHVVHRRFGLRHRGRDEPRLRRAVRQLVRQPVHVRGRRHQQRLGGAVRAGRSTDAAWIGFDPTEQCGCPESIGPCCSEGKCTTGNACFASSAIDAGEVDSSGYTPNYAVLCVGDAGPVDGGSPAETPAIPGVSRWCNGAEVCTTFNGGWACCVLMGPSFATCVGP